MLTKSIAYQGDLAFGIGKFGSPLETRESKILLASEAEDYTGEITILRLADCVDDRFIIQFAAGSNDPAVLRTRAVYQQPGGTILHFTKAAVAANLAIVADAKDFNHAYQLVYNYLVTLGWEDSGHADCGASKNVELSVANPLPAGLLLPTLDEIIGLAENPAERASVVRQNEAHKHELLHNGFYSKWSNEAHEDHLRQNAPQNFATLSKEHDPYGLLIIRKPKTGFLKNQFIKATGKRIFAATTEQWEIAVNQLCPLEEEKARMRVALADDLLTVSNTLIEPGMPLLALAA